MAQLRKEDPELWRRSDVLITTKIFWGGDGVNEKGLSRKHVYEGIDAACARLQVSYVDLVFCHRPDPFTPTETVVRAMTEQIRRGKAMAWGTSEWSAQQITEAFWIAETKGLIPPQFEQPQYNLNHRDRFEQEYAPMYQAPYNMGTTIWSPLASGILTGKYNDGIPEGSRMTQKGYEWLKSYLKQYQEDGTLEKVSKLSTFAQDEFGCSMAQLALAWCVKNKNVTTVLLGATKPEQLVENLAALDVVSKMTSAHMEQIDSIMNNKPAPYGGFGGSGPRELNTI
jgi:voltage-dependent potassium channel beta subunit